jgi:hypothetical protein
MRTVIVALVRYQGRKALQIARGKKRPDVPVMAARGGDVHIQYRLRLSVYQERGF